MTAEEIIKALGLQLLPKEGGYFKVSFTADERLKEENLPRRYQQARNLSGAIYFLETTEQFSALHQLPTDELYFYHYGDPLELLLLHPDGSGELNRLGMDLHDGQRPQLLAPKNSWQGSRPVLDGTFGFSLISTSMAPGFHENDPIFADRESLIENYPKFKDQILALTRDYDINIQ